MTIDEQRINLYFRRIEILIKSHEQDIIRLKSEIDKLLKFRQLLMYPHVQEVLVETEIIKTLWGDK